MKESMTTYSEEELQTRILKFLERYPYEEFKSKELALRLGIRDEKTYIVFKQQLRFLQDKGAIRRLRGKKYAHRPKVEIIRGTFRRNKHLNIVISDETGEEIVLHDDDADKLMNGDIVEVSVLPQSERQRKQGKKREAELLRIIEQPYKTLVGIIERVRKQYIVVPDSKNFSQEILIPLHHRADAAEGDKVVVELLSMPRPHHLAEGKIISVLGKPGQITTELKSVLHEFHLPLSFPPEVINEAAHLPSAITEEEISRREDYRNVITFTIDPEDAKDFDDALSIALHENGNYLLGVHIADVSYYVPEGSAIDKEAYKRGTSVYFPNGVIPMLPERLSNQLCSLRPGEDKLTYSVIIEVTPRGAVKDYRITESIICSQRRFTYEEVQEIIEQIKAGSTINGNDAVFCESLKHLYKLSTTLTKKRLREGSIDFETAEVKFKFDQQGKPTEVIKKVRLESHRLVEECMLLANRVIARHIGLPKTNKHTEPFLYRVHDAPDPQRIQELAHFVKKFGFSLNIEKGVSSKSLQKLLDQVRGSEVENIINEIVLRSMAKAIYSEHNIGHYGLAFDYYSHFTSPIRRYPDLVVHRILKRYSEGIDHGEREKLKQYLPSVAKQSSERERLAMEAERAATKVVQVEYMKRHVGDEFNAVISGVAPYGLFVELNEILVEGMIHVREMMDDYYVYDEKQYALIGQRKKKHYRLGDSVKVKLLRVNAEQRQLDFILLSKTL